MAYPVSNILALEAFFDYLLNECRIHYVKLIDTEVFGAD